MDPQVISALIGGIGLVLATVIGGMMTINKQVKSLMSEFKPNGGSSLKDQLNNLEKSHRHLEERVDRIYEILSKTK